MRCGTGLAVLSATVIVGLCWAGTAHANPAGSPPNLTLTPPNVSPTVPDVSPTPPIVVSPGSRIIAAPRRCRLVAVTDRFGEVREIRRCRPRRVR